MPPSARVYDSRCRPAGATDPTFFATPAELRAWFERHHEDERELSVGFHRKGSGRPSVTWPQAVDRALCFGWIDGVRKRIDDASYMVRFTPPKPTSTWSNVNVGRMDELMREDLVEPAGMRAFERRSAGRSGVYSLEQADAPALGDEQEARFRADERAWAFFAAQPPGYRRAAIWWVVSAKREETRARRLDNLMVDSAEGRRIGAFEPSIPPLIASISGRWVLFLRLQAFPLVCVIWKVVLRCTPEWFGSGGIGLAGAGGVRRSRQWPWASPWPSPDGARSPTARRPRTSAYARRRA